MPRFAEPDSVVLETVPLHQEEVPVRRLDATEEPQRPEAGRGRDHRPGPGQCRLELLVFVGADGDEGVLQDHPEEATGWVASRTGGGWRAGPEVLRTLPGVCRHVSIRPGGCWPATRRLTPADAWSVFVRPDGTVWARGVPRDPEDRGVWTPVGYFSGRAFPAETNAVAAACDEVPWLRGVLEHRI